MKNKQTQEIKARVRLLNYKEEDSYSLNSNYSLESNTNLNNSFNISDGNYSILRIEGISGVNKVYEYEISFVSNSIIKVEDIADTDVEIIIDDLVNENINKKIYGKIFKVNEKGFVSNKYIYEIKVVHPIYYLGLNNNYEIFHNQSSSDIINNIISRYSSVLNISIEIKIDRIKNPIKDYTTQYNQSDLEFILMLCEEDGYSLVLKEEDNNRFKIVLCEINDYLNTMEENIDCSYIVM